MIRIITRTESLSGSGDPTAKGIVASKAIEACINKKIAAKKEKEERKAREFAEDYIAKMRETTPGLAPDYSMVGYGIPAFAYASGIDEWLDLSVEVTDTVVALSESTPLAIAGAQFGRAWVAVQRGEVEIAAEYREPLSNLKTTVGNGWFITPSLPSIDRILGQIAITVVRFARSA